MNNAQIGSGQTGGTSTSAPRTTQPYRSKKNKYEKAADTTNIVSKAPITNSTNTNSNTVQVGTPLPRKNSITVLASPSDPLDKKEDYVLAGYGGNVYANLLNLAPKKTKGVEAKGEDTEKDDWFPKEEVTILQNEKNVSGEAGQQNVSEPNWVLTEEIELKEEKISECLDQSSSEKTEKIELKEEKISECLDQSSSEKTEEEIDPTDAFAYFGKTYSNLSSSQFLLPKKETRVQPIADSSASSEEVPETEVSGLSLSSIVDNTANVPENTVSNVSTSSIVPDVFTVINTPVIPTSLETNIVDQTVHVPENTISNVPTSSTVPDVFTIIDTPVFPISVNTNIVEPTRSNAPTSQSPKKKSKVETLVSIPNSTTPIFSFVNASNTVTPNASPQKENTKYPPLNSLKHDSVNTNNTHPVSTSSTLASSTVANSTQNVSSSPHSLFDSSIQSTVTIENPKTVNWQFNVSSPKNTNSNIPLNVESPISKSFQNTRVNNTNVPIGNSPAKLSNIKAVITTPVVQQKSQLEIAKKTVVNSPIEKDSALKNTLLTDPNIVSTKPVTVNVASAGTGVNNPPVSTVLAQKTQDTTGPGKPGQPNPPANASKISILGTIAAVALMALGVVSAVFGVVAYFAGIALIATIKWTVLLSGGFGLLSFTGGGRLLYDSAIKN